MRSPHAFRLLLALLAAALLLSLLPTHPARAAAAAAPKACPAGELQVRAAVKAIKKLKSSKKTKATVICRKPASGDARALVRKATTSPAQLRALAPRRLRARIPVGKLQRAARVLAATPVPAFAPRATAASKANNKPKRVTARAAAAGDCSGPYQPGADGVKIVRDGVEVTGTGGVWGVEGATVGKEYTLRAQVAEGAYVVRHEKRCVSWDTCPDADGNVKGEYHYAYDETQTAEAKGFSMSIKMTSKVTGRLTGHVGADGRVTTFDADSEGTGTSRTELREGGKLLKLVPATTVRTTARVAGADPRRNGAAPQPATIGAWGINGGLLDGTGEGSFKLASGLLIMQTVDLPRAAAPGLLAAEKVFYDQAACLDVVFDPQPASATPNAKIPVSVKVKAKDGAEVAATYDAQPVDGAVGPPTGTTPATVTWTAPAQLDKGPFDTFRIVAVSKRGRALGTHRAKGPEKAKWWTVTITGQGEYHRYEPRRLPYPQLWSDHTFSYKMVSQPLKLPYPANDPTRPFKTGSASVALTGELHGKRTDGGGTLTCASTPDPANLVGWVDSQGAASGGFDLDITPFPWLTPAPGTDCGTFEDMLHSAPGFEDGIRASSHVTQAELDAEDRIERAADSGSRPLTADCHGGAANGDWPCTHTMSWKATIVLERTTAPAGEH